MDSYLEITLLPDPEFSAVILMNSLYSKLHRALHDLESTTIGVSFPNYKKTLGNSLRLHGTTTSLTELESKNWLGGIIGYCQVTEIMAVPDSVKFRSIGRLHPKKSPAKLRRLERRGSITPEEINVYRSKMAAENLPNPYLELTSASNGHKHRRYIELGPLLDKPVAGEFDQFGLSKTATVPWF